MSDKHINPDEFSAVLEAHRARYPLMKPADMAKLVYQAVFGPAHLGKDPESTLWAIETEWDVLSPEIHSREPEPIGNGFFRYHLNIGSDVRLAAPLLAELCLRTADEYRGDPADLRALLPLLGEDAWFEDWARKGFPSPSHSDTFRIAYQPHYRVLSAQYACYFPILFRIATLLERQDHVVLAIDGRCGSGKTRLAKLIASIFPCNVYHTDDYYLPTYERAPDWEFEPGGNIDLERLRHEVLEPSFAGEPVRYQPYDCQKAEYKAAGVMLPQPLTILEGSYSLHPALDQRYDLKIFLTCSPAAQTRRLKEREGEYFRMFKTRWIPMEERYISRCRIEENAQIIDTSELGF